VVPDSSPPASLVPGRGGRPLDDLHPLDDAGRDLADVGEIVRQVIVGDAVQEDQHVAGIGTLDAGECRIGRADLVLQLDAGDGGQDVDQGVGVERLDLRGGDHGGVLGCARQLARQTAGDRILHQWLAQKAQGLVLLLGPHPLGEANEKNQGKKDMQKGSGMHVASN
jgi:hypothetical protein